MIRRRHRMPSLSSWMASFGCDEDVDGKVITNGGEILFQPARIPDAAFWVVHETEQSGAPFTCAVSFDVETELFCEVLRAESRSRFLDDDCQPVMIKQKCGAWRIVGISGSPLIRADVVELDSQQGMEQVLDVDFVFNDHRRAVFAAKS